MIYRLKNLETDQVLKTDSDEERLYAHAHEQGLMRPADWDEGGPGYFVLLAPYEIAAAPAA